MGPDRNFPVYQPMAARVSAPDDLLRADAIEIRLSIRPVDFSVERDDPRDQPPMHTAQQWVTRIAAREHMALEHVARQLVRLAMDSYFGRQR